MDVKVIKKSKSKEIDLLCRDMELELNRIRKKGFYFSDYLGKESGFFLRKLTTKGLRTLHLQDNIFFVTKSKIVTVEGFSEHILNSNKNYNYMIYMMKMLYEKSFKERYIQEVEKKYQKRFEEITLDKEVENFIKEHHFNIRYNNLKKALFIKKLKRFKMFLFPRYIAITGVDGSGKSTTVQKLHALMGNNSQVIYMGKKDWWTSLARFAFKEKRFPSFVNILILYFEFWIRWLSTFKSTKVIIFDRHPSEMYLSQQGIRRKVYYLLFNTLFPAPQNRFYLHCPVEYSFVRKDDIIDQDEFRNRKREFDKHYGDYFQIDTSKVNLEKSLKIIIKKLNQKTMEML